MDQSRVKKFQITRKNIKQILNPYLMNLLVLPPYFICTGVVANVNLNKTIAEKQTPWVLITSAWGFAVFVYLLSQSSGAHLNPAVTLGLAIAGNFQVFGTWILYGSACWWYAG